MPDQSPHTASPSPETTDQLMALGEIIGFLGICMRFPQASFFDAELLSGFESLLELLEWNDELQEIRAWRQTASDPLHDVAVEHTWLFINAGKRAIAPPYASVYLDGDRNIQGKTTEKTLDFYRQHGFDLAETIEPADHIQYELEFVSALLREGNTETAEEFLQQLFRPWFHRFKDSALPQARHPFYRVSLSLIDFFTMEEQ